MSHVDNPWVTHSGTAPPGESAPGVESYGESAEQVTEGRALRPHEGLPPGPTALPVWQQSARARWWWLGCHGGAGVTSLQRALGDGADALRGWPYLGPAHPAPQVVLVARSSAAGLEAAQAAARQWAARQAGTPDPGLLGLVVVADAPGRLPPPLRRLRDLVAGGVPRTWDVPFTEAWRLGEDPATHHPRAVTTLARALHSLTETGT
ncbi:DUF6668 family protein [Streptomyces sp. NPDC088925]|uniref:DUF6668 family protein n=1 Tax=Streptomyces sp. NPDC088925 TaxID=3365914 RepID=UPI0038071D98